MYWQKRFDRVNPNKELEEKIIYDNELLLKGLRLIYEKNRLFLNRPPKVRPKIKRLGGRFFHGKIFVCL